MQPLNYTTHAVKFPCKNCTERPQYEEGKPNCHSYCEKYLAAKEKAKEQATQDYIGRIENFKTYRSTATRKIWAKKYGRANSLRNT